MAATLGQLIRERRMDLNLTQEELAERIGDGVRQSEISRLERNRVSLPRRQRMEEIAAALEIPIGILLARSGWAGAETLDDAAPEGDSGLDVNAAERPGASAFGLATDDGEPLPPATDAGMHAGGDDDREDTLDREVDDGDETRSSWSRDDSETLRETSTRTESMIEQSWLRIRTSESTIERGRRSVERSQPTDSN